MRTVASQESNLRYSKICPRARHEDRASDEGCTWRNRLAVCARSVPVMTLICLKEPRTRQTHKKFISSTRGRACGATLHDASRAKEQIDAGGRRRMKTDDSGLNDATRDAMQADETLSKRRVKEPQEEQ